MIAGPRNLITDVPGLAVGQAEDATARTGVTVVVFDEPAIASGAVGGGAPGTRETDLLAAEQTVERVDAFVLSGGSAFGLAAADGAMLRLAALGRGFAVGPARVPIVPAAILFDLLGPGDKAWGDEPPYRRLGALAVERRSRDFRLGSAGAGLGATTADFKGGVGSASAVLPSGIAIGALVAVNAVGSAVVAGGPHFRAAPFELGAEFGGRGPWPGGAEMPLVTKLGPAHLANTTLAVVATDAALTKAEAKRLAIAAQDGIALAVWPAHTGLDGDVVFAASTGLRPLTERAGDLLVLCALAQATLARAIARALFEAIAAPDDPVPAWRARFG